LNFKSNNNIPKPIFNRKNSNTNSNRNENTSIGKETIKKHAEKDAESLSTVETVLSNNFLESHESAGAQNELFSKIEKDENIKIINLNKYVIAEAENQNNANDINMDNLNTKENKENTERKAQRVSMLKSIVTIDILMGLKILKNEIKEYFEKYGINVFGFANEIGFSAIGVQEQNAKFSEFLKLGMFNDIYENALSKFFNEFYKMVFTDKEFLGSLEKILVHYFKVNNKLQESDTKIIDFEEVIKIYAQKQ